LNFTLSCESVLKEFKSFGKTETRIFYDEENSFGISLNALCLNIFTK